MNTSQQKHLLTLWFVVIGAVILALLLCATATIASSTPGILYVAPGGNCGSTSPCYGMVQAAVDAAQSGDEIRVAAGTYTGVNNLGGKPQHLYLDKSLTIKGGYTISNWTTPNPSVNVTELQALTLGRVVYAAQDVTATLNGLHLTYGNATGLGGGHASQDAGGGVFAHQATLTLKNCDVSNNATPSGGMGGGIYAWESTVFIEETRFQENTSGSGGGLYLYQSDATVQNSQFTNNQTSGVILVGAFAVEVQESVLGFTGNTVEGNLSAQAGSAIGLHETTFTMTQNQITGAPNGDKHNSGVGLSYSAGLFAGNTVTQHQNQGVYVFAGFVEMINNEIAYNEGWPADGGGGVVYDATNLSTSKFVMIGNHIHHNVDRYLGAGGGVKISTHETHSAYLADNLIEDNLAGDGTGVLTADGVGGGIHVSGDYATLVGNIIRHNVAHGISTAGGMYGGQGGGVYLKGNAILINNFITENQARYAGSGIFVAGATPELIHNTIVNNMYSGGDGAGVYSTESPVNAPGQPRLYNNLIAEQPVGIFATKEDVTSLAIVDGILWYNNGANTGGSGTIFVNHEYTGDPLFINPATGDYHIGPGSAAINKGIASETLTDWDHEPRFNTPDLGADEYWSPGVLHRIYLPVAVKE